ncbi:aminopeptidase B-like isoform X1 [Littorina saxatilis]|uniref:Peptidase M1 leukotriene A4 hydrolase/aminopeptidase C-terminal domain-containing protein n=1 Tax=Littorina saxatilis TaxID=31220 RepID=A0AAN9AZ22_9CAEN
MAQLHADLATDVATSSNFRELRTSKIHLDLDVSFANKTITGIERIAFDVLKSGVREVRLDIHEKLKVSKVKDVSSGQQLEFTTAPFTGYGSTLKVQLPTEPAGDKLELEIDYVALQGGPGVEWLDPAQTAGKVKPYMYTQGQAVCNRSFFPCQDTPAVKAPYSANVKVPAGFTAVMSASESSHGQVANLSGETDNYFFRLNQPIPSYLVALAVGDIKSAKIGPRSSVWAEPCMLDAAKKEFEGEVEKFLSTGERLFGKYQWERYDLLIMPPSFPFGGMENPCLTFVTPCIVVGDRSLTDVVIHEISHSWFGNLVTNANWSEFWLNEGFTMFAQRRISETLFGRPGMCLESTLRQQLLKQHMENTGMDHPLNKLRVVIEPGVDPDDTYNETPYEKGFAFVCYLQSLVGDVQKFDNFLKAYVFKFQFKSIVADDLFDFFLEYFPHLKQQNVADREGYEFHKVWLHTPGWPPYTPDLSAGRELMDPPEAFAASIEEQEPESWPDIDKWTVYQVLHFVDKLVERDNLPGDLLPRLQQKYPRISAAKNAEIRLRWCQLVIKNDYQKAFPDVKAFLHCQGKQKYTLPVYRALMKGSETAGALANKIFDETKDTLHVNVQNYVEEILKGGN